MAETKSNTLVRRRFIVPTAINLLNLVNENIVNNLRRLQDSDLGIPSLYRLAFMVYYNTGELPVTTGDTDAVAETEGLT